MGGNGWDSDDVWDLNGIHLLTAEATVAQKDNQMECHAGAQANLPVAVNWNPIPTTNRFSVFQETEGDGENLEPGDSKMQSQFPLMRESIRVLGERANEVQRSMPRAKFPRKNQLKAGRSVSACTVKPEDVMQLSRGPDEVNRVNSARGLHFLGNLLPTESGIHQVQAAPGFVWKPVTSIVDSGAINNVAPSSVSAKALVESNGSLNGMTYHTADGTRIPNLGQKTLETVSEDGSTQLSQTFQIADISRPLTSVGELADAGDLVVFGRKGQKGRLHREPRHGAGGSISKESTECTYSRPGRKSQRVALRFSVGRAEIVSTSLQSGSAEYRTVRAYQAPWEMPSTTRDMREDVEDLSGEEDFEG